LLNGADTEKFDPENFFQVIAAYLHNAYFCTGHCPVFLLFTLERVKESLKKTINKRCSLILPGYEIT